MSIILHRYRKMKKTIIRSAIALTLMLAACNKSSSKTEQTNTTSQTFNLDTTKLKSGETFYQCDMNPEVLSDKAGNCPKCECHMELSEMKKK